MQPTFKKFEHRKDEAGNSFIDLEISVLTPEKEYIFLLTLPATTNTDLPSVIRSTKDPELSTDEMATKELP